MPAMEADLESELGGDRLGHKRPDPEGVGNACDAKRPREGNNGLHLSVEMEDDDDDDDDYPDLLNPLDAYRQCWIETHPGCDGASFEDETEIPPMRYTDGPLLPHYVKPSGTIQVFSVKVTQIGGALQWPLDVYGVVAARDTKDNKRNILFRRGRDECQTLTSLQDSALELTGPSRAILLHDPPAFEIDLRVKGKGSSASQDESLSYYLFLYNCIAHYAKPSYAMTEVVPSEHSTMEVRFAHIAASVEATIAVRLVSGSDSFKARFTARTESIDEDVVLLDSRGGKVAVADDGLVGLQCRVVVVEERGVLFLGAEAAAMGAAGRDGDVVVQKLTFHPRSALRSQAYFDFGFSRLHVLIAWSMLA